MIFSALSLILFLSGSFSLIYQVAWVRFITLLLGSTTLGITTVVATFMAGLALGAYIASKRLIGNNSPLKIYSTLELIIAVSAYITPLFFNLFFSHVHIILQTIGGPDWSVIIIRAGLSIFLMLIPTICMGASLPVLGKYFQQNSAIPERGISIIYGFNTIGACAGCLTAGFFLLPGIGMINTVYITAIANAVLPLPILLIESVTKKRQIKNDSALAITAEGTDKTFADIPSSVFPVSKNTILILALVVGFAGLSSELIWTRLIILTVGGSVYAYSTILAVYLFFYGTGTAFGGTILRLLAVGKSNGNRRAITAIYFGILLLISLSLAAGIAVANFLPDYYVRSFVIERASSVSGLFYHQVLPAIMLIGPTAVFLGMFFSCGLFMMKQFSDRPAENTYSLYTIDTAGSIAGSIAAAFILIPYLGLETALRLNSILIPAAVVILFIFLKLKNRTSMLATALILIPSLWFLTPELNKTALTAGAGIYIRYYQQKNNLKRGVTATAENRYEMLYYKDGFTSTITVVRDLHSTNKDLIISTNGKPDGSSHFDMPTQKLSAHFPALFHPDPKNACVIGFGTGTTIGSLALHPGIQVDAVEIEPAMIEGAMLFNDFNNRPLSRDNVKLFISDGRLHLLKNIGKYDLIISEPSNPWIAGVSDLFTVEFFKLGYDALTVDGVFGQWVQIYNLDTEAFQLILRTFIEVFPQSYLVVVYPGFDVLLLGSKSLYMPDIKEIENRILNSEIYEDISHPSVNISNTYELVSRIFLGPEQISLLSGKGTLNTDALPLLSYVAPLSLQEYNTRYINMRKIKAFEACPSEILSWDISVEISDIIRKERQLLK